MVIYLAIDIAHLMYHDIYMIFYLVYITYKGIIVTLTKVRNYVQDFEKTASVVVQVEIINCFKDQPRTLATPIY